MYQFILQRGKIIIGYKAIEVELTSQQALFCFNLFELIIFPVLQIAVDR